jgi:hypothetical protein
VPWIFSSNGPVITEKLGGGTSCACAKPGLATLPFLVVLPIEKEIECQEKALSPIPEIYQSSLTRKASNVSKKIFNK